MGVPWRIFTLFGLLAVCAACPEQLKNLCQCDQYAGGALIVECQKADFPAVMKILGSDPTFAVAKLAFRDSSIPTLHAKDLGSVNIRSLEISNCNLTTIEDGAFSGLEELQELVLANNTLSKWPTLSGLGNLKAINLNGNALTDVSENAFVDMPNLQQLWLAQNQICQLSTNALNETKASLELLDLSGNCLTAVPAQNLRSSSRLQYLDLSSNRIDDVPSMQFMNLPQLKEVRLSGNIITRLSAMAFMNVPELQYLFARDNRIEVIETNRLQGSQGLQGFQGLRKLEVLDLTGNLISAVPTGSFKDMISLKQLFLDDNMIERIDTLAFNADPKLQIISLQNNKLRTLSRNAFDTLDQMVVLLLANNSLTDLDRGMFDGMRNLQQLNLRNNSISRIGNGSFDAVPMLTSLDLAYNQLTTIPPSVLSSLKDLFWLDLSNNRLQTFAEGTFKTKVSNILLDNNPLVCDDQINWFVLYLVQNNVRTFLPYQQEVVCAAPKEFAGVRLKELMIRKANETFTNKSPMQSFTETMAGAASNPLLGNLLPSLGQMPGLSSGIPGLMQPIPGLGTLAQAVPQIQNIPGLSMIPMDRAENPGLSNALSQMSGPVGRMVEDTGRPPLPSDVNQIIQSLPNMVVNVPGVGDVDITKLPPGLITHVLNGGSIPGVPQEALNTLVQRQLQHVVTAARQANAGHTDELTTKLLPPLTALDPSIVTAVMNSEKLPGLSADETNAIKQYYMPPLPKPKPTAADNGTAGIPVGVPLPELVKLLPPGFDFSRLPPALLEQASKGQTPDLSLLPADLLDQLRQTHPELWTRNAAKAQVHKQTIDDILRNLPSFTRPPNQVTFKPYDINDLDEAQLKATQDKKDMAQVGLYTAIGLGAVGALTVVVIAVLCYRRRLHTDEDGSNVDVDESELDKTKFFLPKTSSPKSVTAQFDAIGMDNSVAASTVQSAGPSPSHHQRGAFPPSTFDPYSGMPRTPMNGGPSPHGPSPLAWTYGPVHASSARHYSRTEI